MSWDRTLSHLIVAACLRQAISRREAELRADQIQAGAGRADRIGGGRPHIAVPLQHLSRRGRGRCDRQALQRARRTAIQRVGCWRQRLARRQGGIVAAARRTTYRDLQPPRFTRKSTRAKIKLHREQAAAHGDVRFRLRRADLPGAIGWRVPQAELKVAVARDRPAGILELALIRKGCAQRPGCAGHALRAWPLSDDAISTR